MLLGCKVLIDGSEEQTPLTRRKYRCTPIEPNNFIDSIYTHVFKPGTTHDRIQSHRIAVVYMMLAIGALLDSPPHSSNASNYYRLGRAALSENLIFEEQSIPAIQALVILFFRWLLGLTVQTVAYVSLYVPFRY